MIKKPAPKRGKPEGRLEAFVKLSGRFVYILESNTTFWELSENVTFTMTLVVF
jgi:hypothetical protein